MKRPLSVLVKPTSSRCNLNCGYCFYLRKAELYPWADHPKLTLETFEAFLRQYVDGFAPQYNFAWQGGEPTIMGLPFYRAVLELQERVARENKLHPRFAFSNSIQTNATMINAEWARFLRDSRFLVGVSLDGPPELHDAFRVDWKGRPTHQRVMDGVEHLRAYDVPFNVLIVVNSANVEHPREVLSWLVAEGFNNLQFIPCAEPVPAHLSVAETGEISPGSITPEQYGAFLRGLFDAWVDIGIDRVRIRWFDNLIQMLWGQPAEMCEMAATCGYVVLEHNGDCYPCDFFVETGWLLGNVHKATLSEMIDSEKFRRFSGQKGQLHARCRSCSWRTLCYGECPRYRITAAGSADGTLPYFCPSFRQFFERRYPKLERLAVNAGRRLGFPVPGGRLTATRRTGTPLARAAR
ncbi:MAG: anaerobic sulfatase maturase [Chloroflexi bacterium]|nr:anaerobic sulfatase maturase [Chloroflexota bacterium]